jgi:hypothetical protein
VELNRYAGRIEVGFDDHSPWLEQHPTSGRFRWGGQLFKKTVKTCERREAAASTSRTPVNIEAGHSFPVTARKTVCEFLGRHLKK